MSHNESQRLKKIVTPSYESNRITTSHNESKQVRKWSKWVITSHKNRK